MGEVADYLRLVWGDAPSRGRLGAPAIVAALTGQIEWPTPVVEQDMAERGSSGDMGKYDFVIRYGLALPRGAGDVPG